MLENSYCFTTATHSLKKKEILHLTWQLGSYHGAEVYGIYFLALVRDLSQLALLVGTKNFGLYQNSSLEAIQEANRPKMDRIRTEIIALLKSERSSINIDKILIKKNFVDVSFNLEMDKLFSCRKPNNHSLHVF